MSTSSLQTATPSFLQRVGKWIPGVTAFRHSQRAWLPRDLVAGLVLCSLLVPQGMAYAELAGLPAITGLLMSRWDAPLIFVNANLFRNFVR